MSTTPISNSVTTPVVTPTATTEATKPAETVATTTPAAANTVDAFEQAKESPVALTATCAEEADPFADCDFDTVKSGGGVRPTIDPSRNTSITG